MHTLFPIRFQFRLTQRLSSSTFYGTTRYSDLPLQASYSIHSCEMALCPLVCPRPRFSQHHRCYHTKRNREMSAHRRHPPIEVLFEMWQYRKSLDIFRTAAYTVAAFATRESQCGIKSRSSSITCDSCATISTCTGHARCNEWNLEQCLLLICGPQKYREQCIGCSEATDFTSTVGRSTGTGKACNLVGDPECRLHEQIWPRLPLL